MQDILRHLPVVLYEYAIYPDGSKKFLYVSDAAETILGVSPVDVVEDTEVMNGLIHPDDYNSHYESSDISHIEEKEWYWQGRMIIRGEERWVEMRSNHER